MHFGFITVPFSSHFAALAALARGLQARGHDVTFFHQADAAAYLHGSTISFESVGQATHPAGSLARTVALAASPGGPWGVAAVIRDMARTTDMLCRELPAVVRRARIDALIVDQMEAAGGLVAEALRIPFVSVACALPINRQAGLPLPVMPFALSSSEVSASMYAGSTRVYDWMMQPLSTVIEGQARQMGVRPRQRMDECLSPLAQISQTTAGFDFPRSDESVPLHHVGPLRDRSTVQGDRAAPARAFVFASLGTLQGHRFSLFHKIARACEAIGIDLLIAHCARLRPQEVARLERIGATRVVAFADQQAVLRDASAVVTHAGLNTVLDAIASRTPILALPLAFDQAGVAARVVHAQVGYRAWPGWVSSSRLGRLLRAVMDDRRVRDGLNRQAAWVDSAGGTPRAVDIILDALMPAPVSAQYGAIHHG